MQAKTKGKIDLYRPCFVMGLDRPSQNLWEVMAKYLERDITTIQKSICKHLEYTLAINRFIKGNDSFTARENPDYPAYDTYDQLMRLDEWIAHQDGGETA